MIADEVQHDLYGYTRHEVDQTRPAPVVVPVRFTDEAEAYDGFLRALGLTGTPEPGGYSDVRRPRRRRRGRRPPRLLRGPAGRARSEHAAAHLTFAIDRTGSTSSRKRLEDKGFEVTRFDEDFGSFIDVIDPDGQSVQVHQR